MMVVGRVSHIRVDVFVFRVVASPIAATFEYQNDPVYGVWGFYTIFFAS